MAPSTAASMSASGRMTNGPSPPSSSSWGLSAALTAICLPVAVEPVKKIPFTSGCSTIAAPTSPNPCTTLITPSGSPASVKISATIAQEVGANSEGFHTTVLPAPTMWASAMEEMSVGKL